MHRMFFSYFCLGPVNNNNNNNNNNNKYLQLQTVRDSDWIGIRSWDIEHCILLFHCNFILPKYDIKSTTFVGLEVRATGKWAL